MKATLALCFCLLPYLANADSGNELHQHMTSGRVQDRHYTLGFVNGVISAESISRAAIDKMSEVAGVEPDYSMLICLPSGVTLGQAWDVVKQYLENNPAERHWDAALLVHNALIEQWQCR